MMKNAGKPWTPEMVEELNRRYATGDSHETICLALERAPGGVVGKLCALGVLYVGPQGHYYPAPQDPWVQWQEVKAIDLKLKR